MLETFAVVLLIATTATWLRVAAPEAVTAWLSFARDLDPSHAAQHAALFAPTPSRTQG